MLLKISIICLASIDAVRLSAVGSAGVSISNVGSTDVDASLWTDEMASNCQQNWNDPGCHWNMDSAILNIYPAVVNLNSVVSRELSNVQALANTASTTLPGYVSTVNLGAELQPTLLETTTDLRSQVTTLASTQSEMNSDIQSSLVSAQNSLKDSRDKFLGTGNYKDSSTGLNTVIKDSQTLIQNLATYAASLGTSVDNELLRQARKFDLTMNPLSNNYAYT